MHFSAFAQQQQANNTLFGSSLQQNKPSIFGQPSTSAFGATKPTGAFGFGSPQPQTSLFGQASTSTTANTSFGGFGTNATSGGLFGSASATPAFGQSQQTGANGSAIVKYQPLHGTDTLMKGGQSSTVNTKQHCITAMKEYEGKSLEEIRIEDYTANRKGPQAGVIPRSSGGLFGATAPTGGGLFGAPASQPSTGLFGQQQPAANTLGGFGTPAANNTLGGFGQPQGSAFGQATPAQSTGLFGKSFATPATSTAFGGFGTAAPANANLFGAKPFGQQSGGLFGQTPQVSGGSTFGQQPATGFSGFGQTAVNQPAPLFGSSATTANTGFGMGTAAPNTGGFGSFGANTNANTGGGLFPQKPATGFGAAPAFGAAPTSTATGFGSFGQPNTSGSIFNNTFNKTTATPYCGFGTQSTAPTLGKRCDLKKKLFAISHFVNFNAKFKIRNWSWIRK